MKSKLVSLLKFIDNAESYNKAIEAITNSSNIVPSDYKQNIHLFKRHERTLRSIGINPVLLPNDFELDARSIKSL